MKEITAKDLQPMDSPADGWYIIEAAGDHPDHTTLDGKRVDFVQHLTPDVLATIAGTGVPEEGLLVDRDHFSRDLDKPTEAMGWVRELATCMGNLAARIEWTPLGLPLIQGKIYRHFSTVYGSPADEIKTGTVTPRKLIGLALTNKPNNDAGQPAITNRAHNDLQPPTPGSEQKNTNTHTNMEYNPKLLAALGLAEGATEDEVTAAAEALAARCADAENAAQAAVNSEADAVIKTEEEKAGVELSDEEREECKEQVITNRAHGLRYTHLLCNSKRKPGEQQANGRIYADRSKPSRTVIIGNRKNDTNEQDVAITNRAHAMCREAAARGDKLDYYTAFTRARREATRH